MLAVFNLMSVLCILFITVNHKHRIIVNAQPEAMMIIAVGCWIMSWSLIGLTIDDNPNQYLSANAACMITPVMFALGFQISMAGLVVKMWRIYAVFKNAKLRRRKITGVYVLGFAGLVSLLELCILLAWILSAPLTFQRIVDQVDEYGKSTFIKSCKGF